MSLLADFHNHSCLSPCGSLDLSPRRLVDLAAARGLKVLALTDHNSSLNCPAFAKLCLRKGIIPVYGMEATTSEEIHVLCLFTNLDACLAFNDYAYRILLPFPNDPEKTGDQVYVDEEDNILGELEYYLINPLELSVDDIGAKVAEYGGIVIPAHVDRAAFSMFSQLGAVVKGPWAALECTRIPPLILARGPAPTGSSANSALSTAPDTLALDTLGYPLISSSDAHYPEHVARRPFELDIEPAELLPRGPGAEADIAALTRALSRRPGS
jgi:PHP family Zn ribbon phosphoesterase